MLNSVRYLSSKVLFNISHYVKKNNKKIGILLLFISVVCVMKVWNQVESYHKTVEVMEKLWTYVYKKKYDCQNKLYVGGKMGEDGVYYVCKDKATWPYPDQTKQKCLVYSFGISWDFKFDDAIANMGCEVHAFDPSMDLAEGTKRDSGVTFHKIGIAAQNNDHGFNGWKMRTLKSIIKELGHQDRTLDYLKVDTDRGDGTGFEDVVMQEMLATGLYKCIRQYAMEIHLPGPLTLTRHRSRWHNIYNYTLELEKSGFRLFETVDNVRSLQFYNPSVNQNTVKRNQFSGLNTVVLWESHFVNVDLKGSCKSYL